MSDSSGNVIAGTSSDIVLTNVDNTISGAGHIGYGQLKLINEKDGIIIATGTHSLQIDTGLNVVINEGVLKSTGSGGLIIHSDVLNAGEIWAYGGDVTIHGAVTGSGSAMIGGSATMWLVSAASVNVAFTEDSAGTLLLGDSFNFSGLVSGFDQNDQLALADLMFSSDMSLDYAANETGGTLTLSDGNQVVSLSLLGQHDADGWQVAAHDGGGTLLTYSQSTLV
ncbi:MAG TPA: hypothetical protein VHG92_12050 [Afifellaceae bacterium]|nr:hypothetical protein [Afifellaceae bacterium]